MSPQTLGLRNLEGMNLHDGARSGSIEMTIDCIAINSTQICPLSGPRAGRACAKEAVCSEGGGAGLRAPPILREQRGTPHKQLSPTSAAAAAPKYLPSPFAAANGLAVLIYIWLRLTAEIVRGRTLGTFDSDFDPGKGVSHSAGDSQLWVQGV